MMTIMHATQAILEHYNRFDEDSRLAGAFGQFEFARMQELIARYLPEETVKIIDLGGGTGVYSFWLASLHHEVHLVDLVSRHIEIATARQAVRHSLRMSTMVGDARELAFQDASADVILLAGPLYHLTERMERARVLHEAYRVLRNGGVVLAIGINRYAGVLYGLTQGLVFNRQYFAMTTRELSTGVRADPPPEMKTFHEAYFHHPTEFVQELSDAGFHCESCLGVLDPVWQIPNLSEAWESTEKREILLTLARQLERECVLSPQLFCAAHKRKETEPG